MQFKSYLIVSQHFLFSRRHSALKGAVVAIALSLIPLITALTVIDAMEQGILSRSIETATYHLQAVPWQNRETQNFDAQINHLKQYPEITYLTIERRNAAVAFSPLGRSGVMVRAIEGDFLAEDPTLKNYLRIEEQIEESDGVMIGRPLAKKLGLKTGDRLRIMSAQQEGQTFTPKISAFTVSTIFTTGYEEIDKSWIILSMDSFLTLFGTENTETFIGIKVKEPFNQIETLAAKFTRSLDDDWLVYHWKILNDYYLLNIQTTRALLMVVLSLIVLIAVLNTSGSIFIFYLQNRAAVATLQALGASPTMLKKLFLGCGAMVGFTGSLLGITLGTLLAFSLNSLVQFVEFLSNLFNGYTDFSFYLDKITVKIHPMQLIIIVFFITLLSMVASYGVARRVAKNKPLSLLSKGL